MRTLLIGLIFSLGAMPAYAEMIRMQCGIISYRWDATGADVSVEARGSSTGPRWKKICADTEVYDDLVLGEKSALCNNPQEQVRLELDFDAMRKVVIVDGDNVQARVQCKQLKN